MWLKLAHGASSKEIAEFLVLSERTVRRYLTMFRRTGEVRAAVHRNGPQLLLGDFEQMILFRYTVYSG